MFRCQPQKCNAAQFFSHPFAKPGRNVFKLLLTYGGGGGGGGGGGATRRGGDLLNNVNVTVISSAEAKV